MRPRRLYLRAKRPTTPIVIAKNAWCHYPAKRHAFALMQETVGRLFAKEFLKALEK